MLKTPPTVSLSDLDEDTWMVVMQFMSLDDLLLKEKLFGVSSQIFSTLIGCEIQHHTPTNHSDNNNSGLFYRVLNEKLISLQLQNCFKRINRNFHFYMENDYDVETNSHSLEPIHQSLVGMRRGGGRGAIRGGRVRKIFYTRSRVNIEPCGISMSKFRGVLKGLVETCHAQFPHIYQKNKLEIENSLRKSISVCTPIVISQLSEEEKQKGFAYHDNSEKKVNKPSIWNQSKREESILLDLKKTKVKHFKWRTLWSHVYRNYLHYELEYHVTFFKITYKLITHRNNLNWDPIHYVESLDMIFDILSKFNDQFQRSFLTERNFYVKKSKKRYGYVNNVPEIDRSQLSNLDFISHSTHGLVKINKFFSFRCHDNQNFKAALKRQIERNMTLYTKYFEHNLFREINFNNTIYNYLLRSQERDLIEKFFTQQAIDSLRQSPEPIQTSIVHSFMQSEVHNFDLLNTLKFSLTITFKNRPISLLNALLEILFRVEDFPLEDWLNFFIHYFGKLEVITEIKTASSLDNFVLYGKEEYVNIAHQLLGDVIDKKQRYELELQRKLQNLE